MCRDSESIYLVPPLKLSRRRFNCRQFVFGAFDYTSVIGTFLPCRTCKRMSGVQGKPDVTRTSQK